MEDAMKRIMGCAAVVMLLTAAAGFAGEAATAPAAPTVSGKLGDPVELFNGKDLTGWTYVPNAPKAGGALFPKETAWTVKDGVLHSAGKETAGFNTSYLRVNGIYTNYLLTVEQRHVTKGGGGILVGITGPDKVWPKNLQIQGTWGDVGDFIDQYGLKMTVDPARTKVRGTDIVTKKMAPTSEAPLGQWYTVETFVDHGKAWVIVNGVLQNVATETEPLTGTIGFQAEGAQMEFRKVELRPIE
jgi:hypothetical protein